MVRRKSILPCLLWFAALSSLAIVILTIDAPKIAAARKNDIFSFSVGNLEFNIPNDLNPEVRYELIFPQLDDSGSILMTEHAFLGAANGDQLFYDAYNSAKKTLCSSTVTQNLIVNENEFDLFGQPALLLTSFSIFDRFRPFTRTVDFSLWLKFDGGYLLFHSGYIIKETLFAHGQVEVNQFVSDKMDAFLSRVKSIVARYKWDDVADISNQGRYKTMYGSIDTSQNSIKPEFKLEIQLRESTDSMIFFVNSSHEDYQFIINTYFVHNSIPMRLGKMKRLLIVKKRVIGERIGFEVTAVHKNEGLGLGLAWIELPESGRSNNSLSIEAPFLLGNNDSLLNTWNVFLDGIKFIN